MYENFTGVCFRCGFFHGFEESCQGGGDGELVGLRPSNMLRVEEGVIAEGSGGNYLGPWLVAVR